MRTINPLNFFSPRLPSSPSVSESDESNKGLGSAHPERRAPLKKEGGQDVDSTDPSENSERESMENDLGDHNAQEDGAGTDEKTPLLAESAVSKAAKSQTPVIRKIASAVIGSFRVVVAAIFAPGRWLLACFYDDQGRFFAGMPFLRISRKIVPGRRRNNAPIASTPSEVASTIDSQQSKAYELNASTQDTSALTSESEPDSDGHDHLSMRDSPARNTRSKTPSASPESSEAPEKSIKIKAVPQEELRKRKQRRAEEKANPTDPSAPHLTVNSLKSPTGPTSALRLTKYPRAPAPPRPLIPRRQPSFSLSPPSSNEPPKTLVLDLDETLIHSMAKGGRMSTGHMVEVKLSSPVGVGNAVIAPQVPILYYVHKRPHCDEFLRKVKPLQMSPKPRFHLQKLTPVTRSANGTI